MKTVVTGLIGSTVRFRTTSKAFGCRDWLLAAGFCVLVPALSAQTLISPAGASSTLPDGSVSWSVGEPVISTGNVPSGIITQGFQQPDAVRVRINIAAFLQGPYNSGTGLMNDALRLGGLIPLAEPYTALGFQQVGGGGETINTSVLIPLGNDAIVDWIHVQLRDRTNNTLLVSTRNTLVQRDGDVVDLDGISPVSFAVPADDYYIAVFHRNHLGVLTLSSIALSSTPVSVDFTDGSTATYGTGAQAVISGSYALWSGDVLSDGVVKYIGADNDRDPILVEIGGSVPTSISTGYKPEDVNMDGLVKYVGEGNDRDPILQNIGGNVPTAIRNEQMP